MRPLFHLKFRTGCSRRCRHTLTNDVNAYSQLAISSNGKTLATVLSNVDSSLAYYKGAGGEMISSTPLRNYPNLVGMGV